MGSPSGSEAPVIVVGAGVAGLGTALALSRVGRPVVVVERDDTPLPADPDAAFEWDRRGAPQVRHSHALLARLRNLLRDRYPDVLEELLAAGATEIRFTDDLPVDIVDREPRPGDEDLVALACRRTTFEWVLRRIVLASDMVTLRHGVVVDGLVAEPGQPPLVTGVRLRPADAVADAVSETLEGSLVVGAVGRRSAVPRWLTELGLAPDEHVEDTGLIYLSRFYRLRPGVDSPATDGPIGGDLGYLKYAVFQGDNRTLSVTFALDAEDRDLRARLLDPDDFDDAARAMPATQVWADPEVTEPITTVHTMGGLINRQVSYRRDDGAPLVLGFHAVGDAHTCTNPLYGRGCSLGMVQATLLADAVAEHPGSQPSALEARAVAYEEASEQEIRPWYRASVQQDRMNRQAARERAELARAEAGDEPVSRPEGDGPAAPGRDDDPAASDDAGDASGALDASGGDAENARQAREFMRSLMRDGLMPAVRTDATVFRAFVRAFNLLDRPDLMTTDPDLVSRVLAAYAARDERPPEAPLGPDREQLLVQLADPEPRRG
jgi:2-polyprenyl-6-methoxyphenol hydroxylase-like FAD-dependent oxidoreductase